MCVCVCACNTRMRDKHSYNQKAFVRQALLGDVSPVPSDRTEHMLKERNSPLFHKAASKKATVPYLAKRRQRTQQSLLLQSGVKERNHPFSYKAASKNATTPSLTKRRQRTQQSLLPQSGVKERNNPLSSKAASKNATVPSPAKRPLQGPAQVCTLASARRPP